MLYHMVAPSEIVQSHDAHALVDWAGRSFPNTLSRHRGRHSGPGVFNVPAFFVFGG